MTTNRIILRNHLTCLVAACLLVGTSIAQTFESAHQAVQNMKVGWNLGNTLDSNSGDTLNMWIELYTDRSPTAYETAWGQPVTKPELLQMFREEGFGAIRVPVTWYPHIDSEGNVDPEWMARVHEVVDYVIDQGMYCILNVHHDTGEGNTHWLIAEGEVYDKVRERYENLWTNIANEFRDYDEKLLFESYNEMLDSYNSWCFSSMAAPSGYDADVAADAYAAINNYAQSFVCAVRATGGNNLQRNLVVNTYGGCSGDGTWNSHLVDPLANLAYPDDEAENHIVFQVHYYPSLQSTVAATLSGTRQCFDSLKDNLMTKGAPVILGECGTLNDDYHTNPEIFNQFTKEYIALAKDYGIACFFWMILSDGDDRSVPKWSAPDLTEAILQGYYGDDYVLGQYTGYDLEELIEKLTELIEEANSLTDNITTTEVKDSIAAATELAATAIASADPDECRLAMNALRQAITFAQNTMTLIDELRELYDATLTRMSTVVSANTTFPNLMSEVAECLDHAGFLSYAEVEDYIHSLKAGFTYYVEYDALNATEENPGDVTPIILTPEGTDADGNGSSFGWDVSANLGYGYGCVEIYNQQPPVSFTQTLYALIPGTYRLGVQGFYRNTGWNNYIDQDYEDNGPFNVDLFAANDTTHLRSIQSDAEGYNALVGANVSGKWAIPTSMQESNNAFSGGDLYHNTLQFEVLESEAETIIGLVKTGYIQDDWFIWDNWTLHYLGGASSPIDPSAIEHIDASIDVLQTTLYSVNGMRTARLTKGVNIMKTTKSDGSVQIRKLLVR